MAAFLIYILFMFSFIVSGISIGDSKIGRNQSRKTIFPEDGALLDSSIKDSLYIGNYGTFKDERDGKVYQWVRVGDQVWMAQNLAYKAQSGCSPFRWKKRKAEKEGYLYDWETAQKVPPKGWHLPSDDEYKQLITYVGGTNQVDTYIHLVEKDKYGLNFKSNGEYWSNYPKKGKSMFNGGTLHPVKRTKLWTSTYGLSYQKDTLYSFFGIRYRSQVAWLSFTGKKQDRYPIRCVKSVKY
jgi:uncharacterized protein (TIGR02145 family)